MMYPINLPLSALARCWVPFRLSKRRLSNRLSQHQSNSQTELSRPIREDFRISKRKPEIFLNTHPYTNLACNVAPAYLITVTRSVTKRRASPHWKNFLHTEKMSWTYCMHNHGFRTCYRCKIWVSLRKLFAPHGVQSWLRVCWWLVFPIRGKILKPAFRVTEKGNPGKPVFFGFWNECNFERKAQYHCEITIIN